jgi:hypothetical protein
VTEQEKNDFAKRMLGLEIDSQGNISGTIVPKADPDGYIQPNIENSLSFGGLKVALKISIFVSKVDPGAFSGIIVTPPAATPTGSTGKIAFSYKPAQTGLYKFTFELVSPGSLNVISLGETSTRLESLDISQLSIAFNSNKILLAGFSQDPAQNEFFPYKLPVGTTYRIRVDVLQIGNLETIFYEKSLVGTYSPEVKFSWPKPLAPKPAAPTVAATSKKGEVQVSGILPSIWNYPTLPISITVRACRVKNLGSCIIKPYSTLGSTGSLLMSGLPIEDFKFNITLYIDPRNSDLITGPVSDWSKTVRPKK